MVYLFYATYISVDIAHYEIFHAKVGKGGIKSLKVWAQYDHDMKQSQTHFHE